MNWAPCLAASWARCSCFWIIDSVAPVQLAWTSAPRTVRGIGTAPRDGRFRPKRGEGTPGRACRSVGQGVWTPPAVPLGEFATSPFAIEAADKDVGELAIDGRPVV